MTCGVLTVTDELNKPMQRVIKNPCKMARVPKNGILIERERIEIFKKKLF